MTSLSLAQRSNDSRNGLGAFLKQAAATQAAIAGKAFIGADGRAYSYPPVRFDVDGKAL